MTPDDLQRWIGTVRDSILTSLPPETLEIIIESEAEALEAYAGAAGAITALAAHTADPAIVILRRPIATLTQIAERRSLQDEAPTVLAAEDFRELDDYRLLRRGNHWGPEVAVTYTPQIDQALRDRVLLDLILLNIKVSGRIPGAVGVREPMSEDIVGGVLQRRHLEQRQQILMQLTEGRSPVG